MAIPVKCPTCGYSTQTLESESGKIARCPKCEHLIHVPDITWAAAVERDPHQPPPFAETLVEADQPVPVKKMEPVHFDYDRAKCWLKGTAFVLSVLMFLGTMRTPRLWEFISHYAALVILLSLSVTWLIGRFTEPKRWMIIASVVVGVWLWGRNDYARVETSKRNDENTARVDISKYRWRFANWSGPFYLDYWEFEDSGGVFHMEGGYSESGQKHGPWELWTFQENMNQWFWYGEEITEGEWHLRNK